MQNAGGILLDATGRRFIDPNGRSILSDGFGDGCCCGDCESLDECGYCSHTPLAYSVTFSDVTPCPGCVTLIPQNADYWIAATMTGSPNDVTWNMVYGGYDGTVCGWGMGSQLDIQSDLTFTVYGNTVGTPNCNGYPDGSEVFRRLNIQLIRFSNRWRLTAAIGVPYLSCVWFTSEISPTSCDEDVLTFPNANNTCQPVYRSGFTYGGYATVRRCPPRIPLPNDAYWFRFPDRHLTIDGGSAIDGEYDLVADNGNRTYGLTTYSGLTFYVFSPDRYPLWIMTVTDGTHTAAWEGNNYTWEPPYAGWRLIYNTFDSSSPHAVL